MKTWRHEELLYIHMFYVWVCMHVCVCTRVCTHVEGKGQHCCSPRSHPPWVPPPEDLIIVCCMHMCVCESVGALGG